MPKGGWEDDGGFKEAILGMTWHWDNWNESITNLRETAWFHQKRKKRESDDTLTNLLQQRQRARNKEE
eukprot:1881524-Prorocentrum_lima.AAC.1